MKGRVLMIAMTALLPVLADEDSDGGAVGFSGTVSFAVASAGLSAVEAALYGTSTSSAYLPLPDELLSLLATA